MRREIKDTLKKAMKRTALLTIPSVTDKFVLTTDASSEGCGATLAQVIKGKRN